MSNLVAKRPDDYYRDLFDLATETAPLECCGFLDPVEGILPITNIAKNPYSFRMDPAEQLSAMERYHPWAIYHSHPYGPLAPSIIDRRMQSDELWQVIISVPDRAIVMYGSTWQELKRWEV